MLETSCRYNAERFTESMSGPWAGDTPRQHWLPHPHQFMLSQLPGYDVPDPGTDYYMRLDYDLKVNSWMGAAAQPSTDTEYIITDEPQERIVSRHAQVVSEHDTTTHWIQPTFFETTPTTEPIHSMESESLHSTGTRNRLRNDAWTNASRIATALDPILPTLFVQNASYHAAHQPIAPEQQSRYTSLSSHLTFMHHVQQQQRDQKRMPQLRPASYPTQSSLPCMFAETPLTSRHGKPEPTVPVIPLPSTSVSGSVPSRTPHITPYRDSKPPVEDDSRSYTMFSTKAVKGRNLLPAIPGPPAFILSRHTAASPPPWPTPSSSTGDIQSSVPSKRGANECEGDDIIRFRPVSRRDSIMSAPETATASSAPFEAMRHQRGRSSNDIIIPPPPRQGSGFGSSQSAPLPRGTSAAALAAAAAVAAVTGAHTEKLVYTHPPVMFDFAKNSAKLTTFDANSAIDMPAATITRNVKEPRRPSLACTFCRERKIACGRPPDGSEDQTCNQCTRRGFLCHYTNDPKKRSGKGKKRGTSATTDASEPSTPSSSTA